LTLPSENRSYEKDLVHGAKFYKKTFLLNLNNNIENQIVKYNLYELNYGNKYNKTESP